MPSRRDLSPDSDADMLPSRQLGRVSASLPDDGMSIAYVSPGIEPMLGSGTADLLARLPEVMARGGA